MGEAVVVGVAVQETEKRVEQQKAQGSGSALLIGVDANLFGTEKRQLISNHQFFFTHLRTHKRTKK